MAYIINWIIRVTSLRCILRELGDSVTMYQCHFVLAGLHQRGRHASLALDSLQAALAISRELRDRVKETDTLKELAVVSGKDKQTTDK